MERGETCNWKNANLVMEKIESLQEGDDDSSELAAGKIELLEPQHVDYIKGLLNLNQLREAYSKAYLKVRL